MSTESVARNLYLRMKRATSGSDVAMPPWEEDLVAYRKRAWLAFAIELEEDYPDFFREVEVRAAKGAL